LSNLRFFLFLCQRFFFPELQGSSGFLVMGHLPVLSRGRRNSNRLLPPLCRFLVYLSFPVYFSGDVLLILSSLARISGPLYPIPPFQCPLVPAGAVDIFFFDATSIKLSRFNDPIFTPQEATSHAIGWFFRYFHVTKSSSANGENSRSMVFGQFAAGSLAFPWTHSRPPFP